MGRLSLDADNIRWPHAQERVAMEYYAGLDVSMNDTHICVVERDGCFVLEAKARSTPEALAAVLKTAPACHRIVLEVR
jgi:transposase